MKNQPAHFAVCIDDRGYPASLERGKLYRIADGDASAPGYVRVVDESGEEYAYSAERFFPVEIPQALVAALGSNRPRRRAVNRPKGASRRTPSSK